MKIKRKFWNRITAFVCALIVIVSCMGSVPYYANDSLSRDDILAQYSLTLPSAITSDYKIFIFKSNNGFSCAALKDSDFATIYMNWYNGSSGQGVDFHLDDYGETVEHILLYKISSSNIWTLYREYENKAYSSYGSFSIPNIIELDSYDYTDANFSLITDSIIYSDFDVCIPENDDLVSKYHWPSFIYVGSGSAGNENYNSSLGYLQNIIYKTLYLRGDYTYYYNDESRKDVWSYDATTTTGLDLTLGNYSVRHYIQHCLVDSYEDDGVIEKYDKYLMGEYDASSLSLQYLRSDYDKKLEEYGYEGLGFFDSLIGRFILEHHYFQIVNNDTGEVGGYVLIKPKNADKSSFGVEHVALTVNEDGEIDENGYGETIINKDTGAGTTYEEAEENAEQVTVDELGGVEAFISTINNFSSSLGNVPLGIKSIIDLFPWWVLALFGLSFALTFLAVMLKFGKG